jgi:hypothetical protein
MKAKLILVMAMLLAGGSAWAESAAGGGALALAALVADHSPLMGAQDKKALTQLFDGHPGFPWQATKKISVEADAVICRAGNVDISLHSCDLTFGKSKVSLDGRAAHELFATIAEAGVPSDGAAGSVYEGLSHLACRIDPNEIKQAAGGGAECKFNPGPP